MAGSKKMLGGGGLWSLIKFVVWGVVCAVVAGLLGASAASSQSATQRVAKLNRRGVDAFQNLDFASAELSLLQAAQIAERSALPKALLARTYLNLSTVYVAGLQDNTRGLTYARKALAVDASIEPDPLTSTPEVRTVFAMARGQAMPSPAPAPLPVAPTRGGVPGNIPHVPVPEQLAQTPVPVFIAVPDDAQVGPIEVHYQGFGMETYRSLPMKRVPGGYGVLIPCADVYEPQMRYYITARSAQGAPMGHAGTVQQPVLVPIVGQRHRPAPALPGSKPPQTCRDKDCPPDIPDCALGRQDAGPSEPLAKEEKPPRFFFPSRAASA